MNGSYDFIATSPYNPFSYEIPVGEKEWQTVQVTPDAEKAFLVGISDYSDGTVPIRILMPDQSHVIQRVSLNLKDSNNLGIDFNIVRKVMFTIGPSGDADPVEHIDFIYYRPFRVLIKI